MSSRTALYILGGGVLLVTAVSFRTFVVMGTGDPNMDRLRLLILWHSVLNLVHPIDVMAILANESRGNPANYLGDVTAPGGPSIGPLQVYRQTAKDLGLWTPPDDGSDERAAYAAMANDEAQGIAWGVKVYAAKLEEAGGDRAEALRRYNGSGPNALAYQGRALDFLTQTYGVTLT